MRREKGGGGVWTTGKEEGRAIHGEVGKAWDGNGKYDSGKQ